ncbi:MAG: hypothetical protein KAU62_13965 [Candidatus Heimdallarchaeota archaeon]|nr:hypothetical protein [Candidatus Heimdallarchaeota archaeon]MCK4612257.1 hypothetical protein [Candidatus Heimdallarchaeota archaeon]
MKKKVVVNKFKILQIMITLAFLIIFFLTFYQFPETIIPYACWWTELLVYATIMTVSFFLDKKSIKISFLKLRNTLIEDSLGESF